MNNFLFKIIAFSVCVSLLMNSLSLNTANAAAKENIDTEYQTVEARGVWHRPNASGRETNLDGICSVLDEMASAGINIVFVEAFYHGMTLFKTNLVPYYTGFENYDYGAYPDYLSAFSEEAYKRGIEVHAWVETFYLGVNESTPLIKYFQDWLLLNEHGKINHTTEGASLGGYIFFDPANKDVREYLLRFYDELLTKVPYVAGLNIDYIRYPVSDFYGGTDTGYTKTAITEFSEKYGLTVNDTSHYQDFKKQIANNSLVDEWIEYRADQVTAFVGDVANMVNTKHRDSIISVAVHPDISGAYNQKKQDFLSWIEQGYIDVVTPMVYYYNSSEISSAINTMLKKFDGVYCYSGLYTTYHNQSTGELNAHIGASDRSGADGFVLFDSAKTFYNASENYASFLSGKYEDLSPAALPHWSSERLIKASSDIIADMLRANGADEKAIEKFSEKMSDIAKMGEGSAEKLEGVILELNELSENGLSDIDLADHSHIVEPTLHRLIKYLEVRGKRLSFKGYTPDIDEPSEEENESEKDSEKDSDTDLPNVPDTPDEGDTAPRTFFDIIRSFFADIVNWLRDIFNL